MPFNGNFPSKISKLKIEIDPFSGKIIFTDLSVGV